MSHYKNRFQKIEHILRAGIIIFSILFFIEGCKSEPPLQKYVDIAKSINSNLPKELSPRMRMDEAKAISKYKFKFYYTLLDNVSISEGAFIEQVKPQIIDKLKNNAQFKEFKRDNITIIYSYSRNEGNTFAEIEINPHEY